jgi:hypothetical protein
MAETRKLAAILAADVAGYSAIAALDCSTLTHRPHHVLDRVVQASDRRGRPCARARGRPVPPRAPSGPKRTSGLRSATLAAHDRLEIQALPHQPNDKPRDVVLGHKVLHIRRQKQRLIDIPGAKVLAHSPSLNQTRWGLNSDYSDMLLGWCISGTIVPVPILSRLHHRCARI